MNMPTSISYPTLGEALMEAAGVHKGQIIDKLPDGTYTIRDEQADLLPGAIPWCIRGPHADTTAAFHGEAIREIDALGKDSTWVKEFKSRCRETCREGRSLIGRQLAELDPALGAIFNEIFKTD